MRQTIVVVTTTLPDTFKAPSLSLGVYGVLGLFAINEWWSAKQIHCLRLVQYKMNHYRPCTGLRSVVVLRIVSVVLRDAEMLTMIDGPAWNGEIWRMS